MSTRTNKIEATLQKELAPLLAELLAERGFGLVTITRIRVLEDLSEARVALSTAAGPEVLRFLGKRAGFLRHEITPRLYLKKIPQLKFQLDTSAEYVEKIKQLLR